MNGRIPPLRRWALVALLLLLPLAHAQDGQEQGGDDQGWSQFTRDNTLRATVTAVAAQGKDHGSFAVKTDSGQLWKVLYGPNTRFIRDRQPAKAADIHLGDMLFAAGNLDAGKKTIGAAVLIGIDGEEVRKAREGLGKTWSAGKITAVTGRRIEVQRLDGAAQTISVDENTSFQQRHDSVTLADLKPGEGLRAEGHLQNGAFLATTIHVFNLDGHEPWLDADTESH
ncbi:MAG: DUF5666 domain-containing protein [Acidobacteriaceae bacterium]